ncbi:MBL fold metallo-hydrolase [Chryseobacterium sp. T16E-39]|uniref:MBL fold metallo-hydrolase n=1 Tax=Chryseobacterium sp. T16E-39 TaxID=2015076 RepID=UPI000B5B13C0|nr:MBL fold metallo-hydrolase [Chryseobacterium sp. T16E-39]ASK29197.1 MBL fold metallo-hydrolase [Chryseobacterium sp. T16E-39]
MQPKNSASIRIPMGDFDVYLLSDGYFGIGDPQPILAPEIAKENVHNALKELYLPASDYEIPITTLFIKKESQNILVDTGEGYHDPLNAGWLQNSLFEIGISPEDITDILITHAHRDHIGGILLQDGKRRYPNAQYYISAPEYNFWTSEERDFSESKLSSFPTGEIQIQTLEAIKNDLTIFEPGEVLFSCIRTEAAPGHTPGHIIFHVFSGDQSITHLVDLVHSSLLVAYPEWGTQWDVNFEEGIATRKRILERCYLNTTLVTTCHLPWPGIGYIGKTEQGWQWIPKAQSDPYSIRI